MTTLIDRSHLETTAGQTPSGVAFAFVQVNKCAGVSISEVLGVKPKQHLTARMLRARMGVVAWQEAVTFAVIRNPFDRVVSQYLYRKRRGGASGYVGEMSFTDWVRAAYLDRGVRVINSPLMFMPCTYWVCDKRGRQLADRLLRFERLAEDWATLAGRLGLPEHLPRSNASPGRRHYSTYYDSDSRHIIEQAMAEDVWRFGYRFEK